MQLPVRPVTVLAYNGGGKVAARGRQLCRAWAVQETSQDRASLGLQLKTTLYELAERSIAAGIGERIRTRRKAKSLSLSAVADRLGINENWASDLEQDDHDAPCTLSLQQLCDLAVLLSISPRELACGEAAASIDGITTPVDVSCAIEAAMAEQNRDVDAFGDYIGWDVSAVVQTPDAIWKALNLDGLRDVCGGIGLDWRTVLPVETVV